MKNEWQLQWCVLTDDETGEGKWIASIYNTPTASFETLVKNAEERMVIHPTILGSYRIVHFPTGHIIPLELIK